ncbi:hypothetical protein IB270_33050 [Ensifer sp. ENS05]|uniref:hypothetical protein n=1 Tax=Ensifer sp. ENS05 TaxID=2769277 RepID=UPI001786DFF6|nr:hypothetical protein [Ensifer sp. ENS05]MBD9597655.1 hypothetical protein [Ensifer sp. ENS05]
MDRRETDQGGVEFRLTSPFWLGEKIFDSPIKLRAAIDDAVDEQKKRIKRAQEISCSNLEREQDDDCESEEDLSEDFDEEFTIARVVTAEDEYIEIHSASGDVDGYTDVLTALKSVGLDEHVDHFEDALTVSAPDIPAQGYGFAYTPGRERPFRYLDSKGALSPSFFKSAPSALVALEVELQHSFIP